LELSMVAEYCRIAAWEDSDPTIPIKAIYFNLDTILRHHNENQTNTGMGYVNRQPRFQQLASAHTSK